MKRHRWPRAGSLVLVEWDDAGYAEPDDQDDAFMFETVGWLIRRTRRSVWIAAERAKPHPGYREHEANRWRGVTRIPIGMVDRVVKIA